MLHFGIDIGTSTVKLLILDQKSVLWSWEEPHHEQPAATLCKGLTEMEKHISEPEFAVGFTGIHAQFFHQRLPGSGFLEDIPAIVEGTKLLVPDEQSIIEIGSQGSRFITRLSQVPQFATNGHCAGGTGSFFEDQMSRLGLPMESYSQLTEQAKSIPRLSGRCAVFAKTDIIHRQQEGVPTPDILLGLCYAMIKNYKATIVRTLPLEKPVAFCGGVTKNKGVIRAIKDVFELGEKELKVPEYAVFSSAIGAALHAKGNFTIKDIQNAAVFVPPVRSKVWDALQEEPDKIVEEPKALGKVESHKCTLGIDIGSTSTDLVIIGENGELLDYQYLRTAGNPEAAVRKGFSSIWKRFGELQFRAVGVTGSGRERIGRMIGADAVRDEITSQAAGAVHCVPEADTVFEIGGQDSKYIHLQNGEVAEFQMNKICAAGTGSFIEEQAARMGIPVTEFGPLALTAESPANLGERCTVFIETAIAAAFAEGTKQADIAAGLCYSIVQNYLHKVVGSNPVGDHIVLQGGVAYNPGIVAAFRSFYGKRITVNPFFPISGAYGVALLAQDVVKDAKSSFVGFDFSGEEIHMDTTNEIVRKNIEFYHQTEKLLLDGYSGKRDPKKKTVGVPFVLMIHKFFPMANAFFHSLGYNVILSEPTNEDTIRLSQEYASGETCYPVKLIYGHMKQLINQKVDYIFLPSIHTMKHETSRVEHNYGCVYMQTAAASVAKVMKLEEKGITLLNPIFDLDFGKDAMAAAMLGLGKILGLAKPLCAKALLSGAMAVRKHTNAVEKQGKLLLDSLKPEDKVLVLITRNYGVSDPILNMGIPELLLERGYKVITLSHLPGHSLDISGEYPNLYWPFGQHIISGAKLIAHHPNLYAVYLTNHGCGPDSMISHMFREEMGNKPYLQIEVDEHFSKVGVITRIEAFLNSLSKRETKELPADFRLETVAKRKVDIPEHADRKMPLYLPDFGLYTRYLQEYFETQEYETHQMPAIDEKTIAFGRSYTSSKEYLPFSALLGSVLSQVNSLENTGKEAQYLIPQTLGADAEGQYARVIYGILHESGWKQANLAAPVLERIPEYFQKKEMNADLFFRAILTGDLAYAIPPSKREQELPQMILNWTELDALAEKIGQIPVESKRIAATGTPMCLGVLDDGILEELEKEYTVLRQPLIEYLYFLWKDQKTSMDILETLKHHLMQLGNKMGERNPFATNLDHLFKIADASLAELNGGNGRYRFAKAVDASQNADAVLTMAPRYENTAIILEMRGLEEKCKAPVYSISLDHDWDETSLSKLRSFLYYC